MKLFLLLLLTLCICWAEAKTWDVDVSNFQFSPSSLNVNVGDVIRWKWVEGFHTTTSTAAIPAGADPWDANLNSGSTSFDYTVTKAGTYNYLCTIHGLAMSGSFTASGVAPVVLSFFGITTQNGKPLLTWTTQAEINVDHYSVRRSNNGTDFEEIGTVPVFENSYSEKSYTYSDKEIFMENRFVYYSLSIIDKDGKMQFSPIKVFRNNHATPKLIISLSPNPISSMGHLLLRFNADKEGEMKASLVNSQGKIILETELSAEPGINQGHIHLGNYPAGVYILNCSLEGIRESYRIIKN